MNHASFVMLVVTSLRVLASESLKRKWSYIGRLQGGVLLGQLEHEFLWCGAWFAILSEKDTKHEVLKDFESPFEY